MLAHRCMMMVTKDRYEVPYPVSRLNELFVYALTRRKAIDASALTPKQTTNHTTPVV
jgi:hypothetical protein